MVEKITPKDAYEMMENEEDIILLDVRRGSWNSSDVKIAGACRIHPDELETRYSELPKEKLIVPYCT